MVKYYGIKEFEALQKQAEQSPRLQAHLNVHTTLDAAVPATFISTEPDTYMPSPSPSRGAQVGVPDGAQGPPRSVDIRRCRAITRRCMLTPDGTQGVEIPSGVWHGYLCHESGTLALEVKEGAYRPTAEEDFAPWSPRKIRAVRSLRWLHCASRGPMRTLGKLPSRHRITRLLAALCLSSVAGVVTLPAHAQDYQLKDVVPARLVYGASKFLISVETEVTQNVMSAEAAKTDLLAAGRDEGLAASEEGVFKSISAVAF